MLGAVDHAVDALGLTRQAYASAASPSDESMDVLEMLELTSCFARRTARVHLTDVGPTEIDTPTLVRKENAAAVPSRM